MPLEGAGPTVVRSIKQRDLLNTWLRAWSKTQTAPSLGDFQPERMDDEKADLVYLSVVEHDGRRRFRIDDDGHRLADAFGAPGRGTFIDTYFGARLAAAIVPIYEACVERELPAYSVSMVKDIYGRDVAYERLILPFAEDGRIARIVASMKTISEDGGFEIRNLMRGNDDVPEFKVRAIIDRDLLRQPPSRIPDVIEFT